MDNVIDRTTFPLPEQEVEAKQKRRMGLGITGLANVLTLLKMPYGSEAAVRFTRKLMKLLMNESYSCPLYTSDAADELPRCGLGGRGSS